MKFNYVILFLSFLVVSSMLSCVGAEDAILKTDVLVIGEGTGATTAAIQAARSGANTVLITPLPWLGGMLTSAGVSAIDGNHQLPSGLWAEFRDSLIKHYGSAEAISTGWVSYTLFEPHIGDYYWKQMANKLSNLTIIYNAEFLNIEKGNNWLITFIQDGKQNKINARIAIDGTDLGDIAAKAGASYALGMDARADTGEAMAPEKANDIIQDLTYAAILKDYGQGADKTLERPSSYNPDLFKCACQTNCDDITAKPHPCATMLDYAKLPNGKYMINWPIKGNDYYANVVEASKEARIAAYNEAKNKTLQFVYYIQHELGYKNLGLADDEFPTTDRLPLMPYHREGRRIEGLVRLNVNHILKPYDFSLYRTGIAVGDYPIDHHHKERPDAPEIDFPPVPSFSIPLGALIPKNIPNLIVADKAISVTNIVNGASRLQPVIIQIGQVAGLLAAMAVENQSTPEQVNIRQLQERLLSANGYLMPFIDVKPDSPYFQHIQKIGATGILKGKGIPYKWANQTWFYPDSTITEDKFVTGLSVYANRNLITQNENILTLERAITIIHQTAQLREIFNNLSLEDFKTKIKDKWENEWKLGDFDSRTFITKAELAVMLDECTTFWEKQIDFLGEFKND